MPANQKAKTLLKNQAPKIPKNLIPCKLCETPFIRTSPAHKHCTNCKPSKTKNPNLGKPIDLKTSESDNSSSEATEMEDEDDDAVSEEEVTTDLASMDSAIIANLRLQLKCRDSEIQTLKKQVTDLKLIIADKFIWNVQNGVSQPKANPTASRPLSAAYDIRKAAPSHTQQTPGKLIRSYAQAVHGKQTSTKSPTHALILTPKNAESNKLTESQIQTVKRTIEKSLTPAERNFNVIDFKSNDSGEIVVILPTKQDQTYAAATLAKQGSKMDFTVKEAKKRLPRLLIIGIPSDVVNLEEEIMTANPELNNLIAADENTEIKTITFLSTKSETRKNAVIETSPLLRNYIMKSESLKIGMCVYSVTDHAHVLQCAKCQKLGHRLDGKWPCRATKPACGICSEEHFTEKCPSYLPRGTATTTSASQKKDIQKKCVNCNSTSHGAIEKSKCKAYAKYKNDLINRVELTDE